MMHCSLHAGFCMQQHDWCIEWELGTLNTGGGAISECGKQQLRADRRRPHCPPHHRGYKTHVPKKHPLILLNWRESIPIALDPPALTDAQCQQNASLQLASYLLMTLQLFKRVFACLPGP